MIVNHRPRLVCKIPLLARALGLKARASARATIGYIVYKSTSKALMVRKFTILLQLRCNKNRIQLFARDKWLYARYLCSRDALGLKARPSARATIGYLVYKISGIQRISTIVARLTWLVVDRARAKVSCIQTRKRMNLVYNKVTEY